MSAWAKEKDVKLPIIPSYATNNGHMFYIILKTLEERTRLISYLKDKGVLTVFHYLPLHKSDFYKSKHLGSDLPNANYFSDCLLRLPVYFELTEGEIDRICKYIIEFPHR